MIPGWIGIWKCWFLRRGENQSTQRKTSRSKGENQQQTQTTNGVDARILIQATVVGGKRSHHYAIPCSPTCSKRKSLMGIKRMRCCAMSTVTLFFRAIWASCKLCFSWWNKMAAGSYRYPYTAVPGSPQHLTFCLVVTGLQSVAHT